MRIKQCTIYNIYTYKKVKTINKGQLINKKEKPKNRTKKENVILKLPQILAYTY